MYLRSLYLKQFRNYGEQQVEFTAPKTILVGDNAQGKSNLLEAVELLSTLRSHRSFRDRDLVKDGSAIAQISAHLQRDIGVADLALVLRANGRRTVSLNSQTLRRHLDFLGTLNVVQFSSLDLSLVRGGPEQRRHWLDALLIQLEPVYAAILQQYNQILRQRNALLRQETGKEDLESERAKEQESINAEEQRIGEVGAQGSQAAEGDGFTGISRNTPTDSNPQPQPQTPNPQSPNELALWDAQLAVAGTRVIRRRARVIKRLAPLANYWHRAISGSTEDLTVNYLPNVAMEQDEPEIVQAAFLARIKERAIAEQYQHTTLVGPHRDEVEFTINQTSARQYGSQGQQRTLVLALKLAELKLIEEVIGEPPLLLLDDVLAELDLNRQNQLLDAIQDRFQTLITTTHLGSFDAQWLNSSQIFSVKAGQLYPQ
ncbi:MAG: DNA replication/repair protein RecF [Leptolyngbyaceae cyanobacterium bins.302]|nr:DNA replication/repair protein RecF [Leptolyngbyaceae cyanobacterium bins.302]